MDRVERTLRRLALNDEHSLRVALADPGSASDLDAKTQALIRLGALLSVGAETVSLRDGHRGRRARSDAHAIVELVAARR